MHDADAEVGTLSGDGNRRSRPAGGVDGVLRFAMPWLGYRRSLLACCMRESENKIITS
jgi:hypothetical protein